jgi:hypothetical protein
MKTGRRQLNGLPWYWWAAAVAIALLFGLIFLGLR